MHPPIYNLVVISYFPWFTTFNLPLKMCCQSQLVLPGQLLYAYVSEIWKLFANLSSLSKQTWLQAKISIHVFAYTLFFFSAFLCVISLLTDNTTVGKNTRKVNSNHRS